MAAQTPREFLSEFIELYRSFPCLWLIKSKEYSDRNKKDLAYTALVNKYKEFDPLADRAVVVKKISALRTVYKKELAKLNRSSKSGAGADDIYKPRLWYFDLLHFLDNHDTATPTRSTMDDDDGEEETQQDEPNNMDQDVNFTQPEETMGTSAQPTTGDDETSTSSSVAPARSTPRPKRKKNLTQTDEVIQLAGQHLKAMRPDDEFDAYGKYIAHKLRSLKGNQSVFARKLINDVIFEGELETLNKDFKLINIQPQQCNPQLYTPHPNLYFPQQSGKPSQMPNTQKHSPHPSVNIQQSNHSKVITQLQNSQTRYPETPNPEIPNLSYAIISNSKNKPEQANYLQPDTKQPQPPQFETQQPTYSMYTASPTETSNQCTENNISSYFTHFSE